MGRAGPPAQPLRPVKLFGLSGAGARAFYEPPLRGGSERGAARGSGQSGVQHNAHAAGGLPRRARPGRGSKCRRRPRLGAAAELRDRTALRRLRCSRRAGGAPRRSLPCGRVAVAMSEERLERRLAAILAADVAGYSRLIGSDEEDTLARLKAHRRELIDPKIGEHRGRIVKTTGDGILIEFPSVVEAVSCAVAVQQAMAERNAGTSQDRRIAFRIGVNLGDIIVEDGDIHGDGVNIAARLEGIAEPGGVCISEDAFRQVRGKVDADFDDLGEQSLKNITRPLRVFCVRPASAADWPVTGLPLPDKPSLAVLPFQN